MKDQFLLLKDSFNTPVPEEIGGVDLACKVTLLSKPRIYTLVSQRAIPHGKRGNRLFFRKSELLAWLDEGNRQQR